MLLLHALRRWIGKWPPPFTTILQWIYLLEANWQDAPDTSGERSAAHNEGSSSTSLSPSLFQVPPFSRCLRLLFFHPGLRLPNTGISPHESCKRHCFWLFCVLSHLAPSPLFLCVCVGEGVAMLLIVAGVFLASCSDILASCSELLDASLLGWIFLICDISAGLVKLGVSPAL